MIIDYILFIRHSLHLFNDILQYMADSLFQKVLKTIIPFLNKIKLLYLFSRLFIKLNRQMISIHLVFLNLDLILCYVTSTKWMSSRCIRYKRTLSYSLLHLGQVNLFYLSFDWECDIKMILFSRARGLIHSFLPIIKGRIAFRQHFYIILLKWMLTFSVILHVLSTLCLELCM